MSDEIDFLEMLSFLLKYRGEVLDGKREWTTWVSIDGENVSLMRADWECPEAIWKVGHDGSGEGIMEAVVTVYNIIREGT